MSERTSERAREREREKTTLERRARDRAAETEIAELERENADLMNAGPSFAFYYWGHARTHRVTWMLGRPAMRSAVVEAAARLVGRRCFQGTIGILVRRH